METIDFLIRWMDRLFKHATTNVKGLGINMTLGIGPGWTGSGGPWVLWSNPCRSRIIWHCSHFYWRLIKEINLPVPLPKKPYFG